MKILTICNQKGGVGKSTIAVHTLFGMAEAAEPKPRVLFLDLDHQANSSKTLQTYACGITAFDMFVKDVQPPQNMDICAICSTEESVEVDQLDREKAITQFQKNLVLLGESFDYCVIDTPPGLALRMLSSVLLCDYLLIPLQLEEYALDGTTMMLQTFFGWKEQFDLSSELLGLLPNLLDPVSKRQKDTFMEIYKEHGGYFLKCKIGKRPLIAEAIEARVPVWRLTGKNTKDAAAEFEALFKLIFPKIGLEFTGFKKEKK